MAGLAARSGKTRPRSSARARSATVRRRLAAIGKMHRFNDLAWNSGHRDIAGPLGGLLRERGRPTRKAAALTLAMLRQLVATCDGSNRGRRDRALLLIGFAAALRRSELVALQVEDVAVAAQGLRLRIVHGKTDRVGQGAEIGLPRGRHAETCPVRAFEAWQAVAKREAGPLFRRISTGGRIGGGQAENHLKAWKTHLVADRTSCCRASANQMRLFLHLGAYWLMWSLRADAATLLLAGRAIRHAEAAADQAGRTGGGAEAASAAASAAGDAGSGDLALALTRMPRLTV